MVAVFVFVSIWVLSLLGSGPMEFWDRPEFLIALQWTLLSSALAALLTVGLAVAVGVFSNHKLSPRECLLLSLPAILPTLLSVAVVENILDNLGRPDHGVGLYLLVLIGINLGLTLSVIFGSAQAQAVISKRTWMRSLGAPVMASLWFAIKDLRAPVLRGLSLVFFLSATQISVALFLSPIPTSEVFIYQDLKAMMGLNLSGYAIIASAAVTWSGVLLFETLGSINTMSVSSSSLRSMSPSFGLSVYGALSSVQILVFGWALFQSVPAVVGITTSEPFWQSSLHTALILVFSSVFLFFVAWVQSLEMVLTNIKSHGERAYSKLLSVLSRSLVLPSSAWVAWVWARGHFGWDLMLFLALQIPLFIKMSWDHHSEDNMPAKIRQSFLHNRSLITTTSLVFAEKWTRLVQAVGTYGFWVVGSFTFFSLSNSVRPLAVLSEEFLQSYQPSKAVAALFVAFLLATVQFFLLSRIRRA